MCTASFDTTVSHWLGDVAEQEQNTGNSAGAELYRLRAQQCRELEERAEQFDPLLVTELATAKARILELERKLAEAQRALAA